MLGALLAAYLVIGVGFFIEASAQRGQRIYRARQRDHSKVPSMRWRDEP